jgi:hypothetical protein
MKTFFQWIGNELHELDYNGRTVRVVLRRIPSITGRDRLVDVRLTDATTMNARLRFPMGVEP